MVAIKLIAPAIEDTPARWRLNIAKSTAHPEWAKMELKGGYTVHPVPTPDSTKLEVSNKIKDGGNNQKERLFSRGKAISGLPINIGTNQLPKAPIKRGITIKKIIIKAWEVTITLYNWVLPERSKLPGWISSIRIKMESHNPRKPLKIPKIRYSVPISLWFVEQVHLIIYNLIWYSIVGI
jgi:hypothetical protein